MVQWIDFEIGGIRYFLLCKSNENNDFDALLYNGQESWYEKQSREVILARVKEQNRRIQYDENTIKETLQSAQPTEATWLEDSNNDDDEESPRKLKLKYHVKSCPFNFTWQFIKQSEHDFQKFILFPLFRIVQGLTQQNNELREVVRKKDIELKQFKYEGAVLKRVTVSTQPFDFTSFDEKFSETLELSKCMLQISELLKAQYSQMKTPLKSKPNDRIENDDTKESSRPDLKLTPRRKRRKLIEEQQQIIAEKLRARNKPFAYESSQSQTLSFSDSDHEAPSTSKKLFATKQMELKIENDLDEISATTSAKPNLPAKVSKQTSLLDSKSKTENNLSPSTRSRLLMTKQTAFKIENDLDEPSLPVVQVSKQTTSPLDSKDKVENNLSPSTRSRTSKQNDNKLSTKLFKNTSDIGTRISSRNVGIKYCDSSESPNEEDKPENETSSTAKKTQKIELTSNESQSSEKLSDDVQRLIDEWKALEKRRIADLKIRQK